MESLALSDSHDSASSEDGPNSQSHRPLPHYLSRHTDHKDQSLDLSDGDYASDVPSETRFNEEHHTSTPMSSSSSFSSDSELKSLEGLQISSLKQQLMERESHWLQAHSLLQSCVEALTRENQELHSRLNVNKRSHQSAGSSTLQPDHHTDCLARSRHLAIPWFAVCNFSKISLCKDFGITSQQPFNSSPFSTVNSPANWKYGCTMASTLLLVGQPSREYFFTSCKTGSVERLFWSGCRVITFRNGTKKEIGVDKSVTVTFFNGDVKRTLADGTVVCITITGVLQHFKIHKLFCEKHHPDGTRETSFPDGTVKILHSDGQEESIFPDGTVVKISPHGEKVVEFTNGQREIHTSQYKRRMFPDGTVKTVYTNGRQETKFSSGRLRIKNNEGLIILDKK
uniref:Centromere protein J C-terminal domain-containing protein n=1 Tax=Sinocyclocheilus anshuiensis TaxID=1608454 RepID=A0A671NN30_9TELE